MQHTPRTDMIVGSGPLERLVSHLEAVALRMLDWEARLLPRLEGGLREDARASARNLLHYLALRSHDLREDQEELARLGLSSLGRAEPHALENIRSVIRALQALAGHGVGPGEAGAGEAGRELLRRRTVELLGPNPEHRLVRIMVTMPTEAATDYALVRSLVAGGMNVMRINCAHDGPEAWEAMVGNLRRAREELGKPCRVVMDIEGPKLRTGPVEPGPCVVSWQSKRTSAGDLVRPSLVGMGPARCAEAGSALDAWLRVSAAFTGALGAGSEVALVDRPGRRRMLRVVRTGAGWAIAEATRSAFVEAGTRMEVVEGPGAGTSAQVGGVPALEQSITIRTGDQIVFTADQSPGRPAVIDASGTLVSVARMPISLVEAVSAVKPGHRVLLDDGKAEGVVARADAESFTVTITRTRAAGLSLRADRGLNLPDSDLPISALTVEDRKILGFVAAHADAVEFSFVRTPQDLEDLRQAMREAGGAQTGVVLKIETAAAFENLPELLLAALTWPSAGVMIARGDLAVEIGYERMAEVQEEILWLCEAAHLPVIWATQVLESLAKKGIPSRSEITDAAMGERAECVMLNKGPYVMDAVTMLDNILRRMADHQEKKRSMLRPLNVARVFGGERPHTRQREQ